MDMALAFIEPTDSGVLEDLFKKITRDGEKRLMLAILENATEDFQKYALVTDKRRRQLFEDAEAWIFDGDDHSLFSFESICEHLQLDPEYMRQGFRRWKAANDSHHAEQCAKSAQLRAS